MADQKRPMRTPVQRAMSSRTLICVDAASLGFLGSSPIPPPRDSVDVFLDSSELFNELWHDPRDFATVVLDSCPFDFEELFYACLNHTHVCFVVRSPELGEGLWYERLARRPNVRLPCTDFMVWTYAFSSKAIKFDPKFI